MPLFILNIAGWIVANWRLLLTLIAVAIVLGFVGFLFSKCDSSPKLNEQQIQKNQDAVASKEREKMEEALVESRVIEKQIDANRADAENTKLDTLYKARQEAKAMSNEDLARTLEGLK